MAFVTLSRSGTAHARAEHACAICVYLFHRGPYLEEELSKSDSRVTPLRLCFCLIFLHTSEQSSQALVNLQEDSPWSCPGHAAHMKWQPSLFDQVFAVNTAFPPPYDGYPMGSAGAVAVASHGLCCQWSSGSFG